MKISNRIFNKKALCGNKMTIFVLILTANKSPPTKSDAKVIKPYLLMQKSSIKIQKRIYLEIVKLKHQFKTIIH